MTTSDSDESGHLRREAAPLEFKQLTSDQQRAGVQAARLLKEMSESKLREPESSSQHSYLPEIDPIRDNHVVLIDGRRGSGKSLLLLTLVKSYRDAATGLKVLADFEDYIAPQYSIIPVGLIDLQPLPEDTNLLFYILGHLERVVEAIEGDQGEPRQRVAEAWEEVDTHELPSRRRWRELARAAAFGWGGNLKERKARLDPEAYAVEMEHGELQRLDAMHRFRLFMEALVSDYQQWRRWNCNRLPFFLLSIDDADMNPDRSGELLELVRKLWHRRLGFLLTGDSSLFIAKLRAELETKMSKGDLTRAQHLAYDVYAKTIPIRQRCALPPIGPDEVLLLPQPNPIRKTLQQFPVCRGLGATAAQGGEEDLAAFFDESAQMCAALPDRLRSLLSMQEELKSLLHLKDGSARTRQAVLKIWENALNSARGSGFETERWRELVGFDAENKLLVVKSTSLEASFEGAFWRSTQFRPQWKYAISTPGNLRVFGPVQGRKDVVELPSRVVSAFLLAHEFVHVDEHGSYEGSIVPEHARTSFVEIRWSGGGESRTPVFSWVLPAWSSFLDFHRFVTGWKRLLEAFPSDNPSSLDLLGWGFLGLVAQSATGGKIESMDLTREPDWAQWGQAVVEMSKSQATEREAAMKDWALKHSAQLATPEAGTSPEFAEKILGALSGAYGRDWKQVSGIQVQARLERAEQARSRGRPRGSPDQLAIHMGTADALLSKIDGQFPDHPFVRRVVQRSRQRSEDRSKAVERLIKNAMDGIDTPETKALLRNDGFRLGSYVSSLRQTLLELNQTRVLNRAADALRQYREIGRGAAYAVVALWDEVAIARGRKSLKQKVTLAGDRVVIKGSDLRQRFYDQLRVQWSQVPERAVSLDFEQGLVFHLSKKQKSIRPIEPSVPLGMEPLLRVAYDYSVDQDDLEPAPPPLLEWWPYVTVTLPRAGTFAPWPAIPWPSLWEWEELQARWNDVLKKSKLLAREGAAKSSMLDALASWLVNEFLTCKTRSGLGTYLRASQNREDWIKAVLQWRDILKGEKQYVKGRRARAINAGLQSLILLATPESGLSIDAVEGILSVLGPGSHHGALGIPQVNHLRLQRMLDAGIPESNAQAALELLDRGLQEHPWVKKVGPFQLPPRGAGTRSESSDGE